MFMHRLGFRQSSWSALCARLLCLCVCECSCLRHLIMPCNPFVLCRSHNWPTHSSLPLPASSIFLMRNISCTSALSTCVFIFRMLKFAHSSRVLAAFQFLRLFVKGSLILLYGHCRPFHQMTFKWADLMILPFFKHQSRELCVHLVYLCACVGNNHLKYDHDMYVVQVFTRERLFLVLWRNTI